MSQCNVIEVKPLQPLKELFIEVMELGMSRLPVKPLQFMKVPVPIVVTEFGMTRLPE